jgi:hypothetical protein
MVVRADGHHARRDEGVVLAADGHRARRDEDEGFLLAADPPHAVREPADLGVHLGEIGLELLGCLGHPLVNGVCPTTDHVVHGASATV